MPRSASVVCKKSGTEFLARVPSPESLALQPRVRAFEHGICLVGVQPGSKPHARRQKHRFVGFVSVPDMNVLSQTLSGWLAHDDGLRARLHAAARNAFANAAWLSAFGPPPASMSATRSVRDSAAAGRGSLPGESPAPSFAVPHGCRLGTGAAARTAHAAAEPAHRLGRVPAGVRRSAGRSGSPFHRAPHPRRRIAVRRRTPLRRRLPYRASVVARQKRPHRRRRGRPRPVCGRRFVTRPTTCLTFPICWRGSMAGNTERGGALDLWQRQAVLAAAALLRHRFSGTPDDSRARTVHDALLEVVEPKRRAVRLQREMSADEAGAAPTLRSERRGCGRRAGIDRRLWEFGPPRGVERRGDDRRTRKSVEPGADRSLGSGFWGLGAGACPLSSREVTLFGSKPAGQFLPA